jgi:hypothetical protein
MAAPRKPKNTPSAEGPSAKKLPSNPPASPVAQPRATRSRTRAQSVDAELPAEQRATQTAPMADSNPAPMPAATPPAATPPAATRIDSGDRNRSHTHETPAAGIGLEDSIRRRAYELYEQRGRREGHALDDWLEAEAQVRHHRSVA